MSSLTLAQRARAASAYRHILRSARLTFGPDLPTLLAFKSQTRLLFHRFLPSSPPRQLPPGVERIPLSGLEKELDGVFEAARYLRSNVVQGVHRSEGGERIALRIHRDTELGDNESIRRASPFSSGDISATAAAGGGGTVVSSEAAKERREKRRRRREQLGSEGVEGEGRVRQGDRVV